VVKERQTRVVRKGKEKGGKGIAGGWVRLRGCERGWTLNLEPPRVLLALQKWERSMH